MRIAFIGVSHWHAPMYYRPAARLAGIRIIAVSDPTLSVAESAGRELEARAFADYRELIAEARPDFVFAFGRHCEMAETALTLIGEGIPFLIEKPGGLNFQQVSAIRDRARAKGLHAGTGFNFRVSDLYRKIQAVIGEDSVTHASFRFIAGGPYRYREAGCAWMLDPKLSGGGSTINLSVHFIDMFRVFARSKPGEVASLMGRFTWDLPIEDYSSVILRSRNSVCTIETGYTYPAMSGVFDLRFSIRTTRYYIVVRSDNVLEVHRTCDGHVEQFPTQVSNAFWYPVFVAESIDRFAKGQAPLADLNDLADVMEVVDAAYASDRAGGAKVVLGGQR
jgi:predicted dehydrogenase